MLNVLILMAFDVRFDLKMSFICFIGSQDLAFLFLMSFSVPILLPRSLHSFHLGSGGLVGGGRIQSRGDHRVMFSGGFSGGGGGGGAGRLSGASYSSVLLSFADRL